jgi:nucleoside recognition membrane protein YjiH
MAADISDFLHSSAIRWCRRGFVLLTPVASVLTIASVLANVNPFAKEIKQM